MRFFIGPLHDFKKFLLPGCWFASWTWRGITHFGAKPATADNCLFIHGQCGATESAFVLPQPDVCPRDGL